MEERLLVLAKACPVVSKKYEQLVCIGGINQNGEWRRIYPVPWKVFWKNSNLKFKKKSWIEFELRDIKPSDHRQESRKINFETIKLLKEEKFSEIKKILDSKLTTLEELQNKSHKKVSLGVIKPKILDFMEEDNPRYGEIKSRKFQKTLNGNSAVIIEPHKKLYSYIFYCSDNCKNSHKMRCEDWELGELYRNCHRYLKDGKYRDEQEVFEKIRKRMMDDMLKKKELYFIVGTHARWGTYLIVGVIYPKKTDLI